MCVCVCVCVCGACVRACVCLYVCIYASVYAYTVQQINGFTIVNMCCLIVVVLIIDSIFDLEHDHTQSINNHTGVLKHVVIVTMLIL